MELLPLILFITTILLSFKALTVVPQQNAYVVERFGRYHSTLLPGLNVITPFVDRIAYKHNLKEVSLDVPSQVCITRDNTQLKVDGLLYFQVTDAQRASYGSSNFIIAITQLSQTTLRSVIGKMELDKTFEERDEINQAVVSALDKAAINWGVKVLRYEIKDLLPPQEILHAMQAQITSEREKRARIAQSEGVQMEQINLANGAREAAIQKSQGEMQATINNSEGDKQASINKAIGEAEALRLVADATADAIRRVGGSIHSDGGLEAVNLKVAEQYVAAFGKLAKESNTLILPANVADLGSLVASAISVVKQQQR